MFIRCLNQSSHRNLQHPLRLTAPIDLSKDTHRMPALPVDARGMPKCAIVMRHGVDAHRQE